MSRGPGALLLVLITLVSQSFSLFLIPHTSASQSVNYTLTLPFERTFREEGRFKPPVKFGKGDNNYVLSNTCKVYVGAKPVVNAMAASGRLVSKTGMVPAHRLNSAKWIKDSNGENVYRFRGTCVFVGRINLNFPTSNFYTFDVYAQESYNSGGTSYPYTLAQLKTMKDGIREARRGPGASLYTFSPVPDIDTPKVQPLVCIEGSLISKTENEEEEVGEKVVIAYFAVTNSIYKRQSPSWNYPELQQVEERPENTEEYFIEYDYQNQNFRQEVSEDTPIFMTWRKIGEKNFTTKLRGTYSFWGVEDREVAREKSFVVQIPVDCKSASVTLP